MVEPGSPDGARDAHWQPLSGTALLERLRCTGRRRPAADGALVQEIRDFLDRLLADVGGEAGDRMVVTKDRLTRALSCPAHRMEEPSGERTFSLPLACGAMVDALFRQVVTTGTVGDAVTDAIAALTLDGHQAPLLAWIADLEDAERSELEAEVSRQADGLRVRWPRLDPAWLPRTQESLRVPLADTRVELSARVDLAVGRPGGEVPSVALVEVKSGVRRPVHRSDLHFYALVETVRSGAPPFSVSTYYARTGELDVDCVTPELLVAAARRCAVGSLVMAGRLDADAALCPGCSVRLDPCVTGSGEEVGGVVSVVDGRAGAAHRGRTVSVPEVRAA